MLRKFLIYFLYYFPICKHFKVTSYSLYKVNNLRSNQIAINRYKYWIYDKDKSIDKLIPCRFMDIPENILIIITDCKYSKYVYFIHSVLTQTTNIEIFNTEIQKLEQSLICEYLNTNLLKY